MDGRSDDEIAPRRAGCFGTAFGSSSTHDKPNQTSQPGLGSSTSQSPKPIPTAKASTFTRWFSSSPGQAAVDHQALDDEQGDVDQDRMLAQLADDLLGLDDTQTSNDTTYSPSPKTPAHERKRSWPFSVSSRRVAPQPSHPTTSTNPTTSRKPSAPPPVGNPTDTSMHGASSRSIESTEEDLSMAHSTCSDECALETVASMATTQSSTAQPGSPEEAVSATRRLWKTISGVRKGDKVLPVHSRNQGREVTVESLVRAVQVSRP